MNLRKDLLWGGATTVNQLKGASFEDGKEFSIADVEQGSCYGVPRVVHDGVIPGCYYSNHEGIDFYHRHREDVGLLAGMRLNCSRMLINWPRVSPQGDEIQPNKVGLTFYDEAFDIPLEKEIQPIVTSSRYETPLYLVQKYGSWRNRKMIECFERHCRAVFTRYKDEAKYWVTFNEIDETMNQAEPCHQAEIRYREGEDHNEIEVTASHNMFPVNARAIIVGYEIGPWFKIGYILQHPTTYPKTCRPGDILA